MPDHFFYLTPASRLRITRFMVGSKVKDMERELIIHTLHATHGNRSVAARLLGLSVRTMRNKITEYSAEGVEIRAPEKGSSHGAKFRDALIEKRDRASSP